jgi:gliding motility-associatede transport system auxiliary component
VAPFKKSSLGAATFLALAALFVGLTILANETLRGARLDLTQNKLYTLARGTERLVGRLQEPINLYFYFSQQASSAAPPLRAYAVRVRELLEELAARSGGMLRLHVIDPQPYSEDEDRATEAGLKAVPVGSGGDTIWFGLAATNSTDGRASIEFFQPQKEEFLEYDVARVIHQLAQPKRKLVGLLSSLPMGGGFDPAGGGMRQPWVVQSELAELFDLKPVAAGATELPAGLDALVVIHPKGLSPALSYAIDQYVVGGGHLFVAVDPDAQFDSGAEGAGAYAGADKSSTLEPMLAAWGVGYDPHQAVGDLEHALLVGNRGGGEPVRHLGFAGLGGASLAKRDVITSGLDTVNFGTPGFLTPKPVAGLEFEPLISSGKDAAPIPVEKLAFGASPESLRQGFKGTGQSYVVAARIAGIFPSAFPGGAPPGAGAGHPHLARGTRPGNVVVVADTDFLADMLWVRASNLGGQPFVEPWASNGDFLLNAVDNLTGSADLVGIRGRASFSRPFTRVEALRARADERLRATEVELERELSATERKLADLQTHRADRSSMVLTPEQGRELERFQNDRLRIRKELRGVRRGLDQEIEHLGTVLKLMNVTAVPLLLSLVTLAALWARRRRRRQRRAASA